LNWLKPTSFLGCWLFQGKATVSKGIEDHLVQDPNIKQQENDEEDPF